MTTDKLKEELNNLVKFPGVTNAWVMPIKTRIDMLATGIKTPVGLKIAGPDLSRIEAIGKDIEVLLANVENTASVYAERVVEGDIVIFPSFIIHRSPKITEDVEKIIISFNLDFDEIDDNYTVAIT